MPYASIPASVQTFMNHITDLCGQKHANWAEDFNAGFANTLLTTVKRRQDGTTFLLTGDIPAMWLRDSAAQMRPYLVIAEHDPDLADMIEGLVRQQFRYIAIDPYANAFNEEANSNSWDPDDRSDFSSPWLWERKYELDSLCYPIQLAWLLHTNTGRVSQFDSVFVAAVGRILDTLEAELDHANNSPYFFIRNTTLSTERIGDDGNGSPVAVTGMVWQGFRSSDDACVYHYVIPANMFAVVAMDYLERIFSQILDNPTIAARARALRESIDRDIREYSVINNRAGERIFAYEVDGLGHSLLMDDGNGPSLLAAPYLGYCKADDPVYAATRRTLLSTENPYYYEGRYSKGIAPPHTATLCVADRTKHAGTNQRKPRGKGGAARQHGFH